MAFDAHKDLAYSTVATAPSPPTSGVTLVLQAGDGAKFPAAPFDVTIWLVGQPPTTTVAEIARCTALVVDTMTLTRGSPARAIVVGDQIANTITAQALTAIEALVTTAVQTGGSYADPSWLTSLAATKLTGTIAAAQMPALTGDVTTSAGAVATTIGAGKVTNAMLAGSIAASKLVGTDIATVGTLTAGATGTGFTVALSTSTITGTLADARLSANVPLLNVGNTFTVAQTISSATSTGLTLTNANPILTLKRSNNTTHADAHIVWQSSNATEYWRIGVGNTNYGLEILDQGVSRFIVAVGGNVGIGTTSPQQLLSVTKTSITSLGTPQIYVGSAGVANEFAGIGFGWTGATNAAVSIGGITTTGGGTAKGAFVIATRDTTSDVAPTERMRINASGEVGIGMTATKTLDVTGTFRASGEVFLPGKKITGITGDIACAPNVIGTPNTALPTGTATALVDGSTVYQGIKGSFLSIVAGQGDPSTQYNWVDLVLWDPTLGTFNVISALSHVFAQARTYSVVSGVLKCQYGSASHDAQAAVFNLSMSKYG